MYAHPKTKHGVDAFPKLELSRHAQSQILLCEHAPRLDAAKPDPHYNCRGMLREHAPRLDAAKPDPPSATGAVPYEE